VFGLANDGRSRSRQVKRALGSFLILLAVLLVFVRLSTAEIETGPELLGPENWPVTVEDTVRDLLPRIPRFQKLRIWFVKKDDLISLHHGFGTWIRNRYGLWRGNDKLILSACSFRCHPDDASMKIIEAVWEAEHK
jgi:hypothetical protein